MGADLRVASEQARRLERLIEQEPPERVRGASDVRDGTSYVDVLHETCASLDELCSAYRGVERAILHRRAAAAAAQPRADGPART